MPAHKLPPPTTDEMRAYIWERCQPVPECGCWIWMGSTYQNGYGTANLRSASRYSHRLSWAAHRGAIPLGLFVCHHCDVRECVNPSHLFLGTHADNVHDMLKKGRGASREQLGAHCVGEMNPKAKLQPVDILLIRASKEKKRNLAKRYGVNISQIWRIKTRRQWGHIT